MPSGGKGALGAAVVGAGLMGGWHAAAIRRAGGEVVAVVDPDGPRAAALAARFPPSQAFTRLEDALSRTRPAVAHLCTPTATHVALAAMALQAGAHILVEKPLAPTLKDTEEIFSLAKGYGLAVCPVHQFIFQDGVQRLQSWLPGPEEIVQVSFRIHSAGGLGLGPAGLDALAADILPHPLSVLQALLPGSLEAPWSVSRPAPGELRAAGAACGIGHSGPGPAGAGIAIEISMSARPTLNILSVATRRAAFTADLFHGFAVRLPGGVSRPRKIVQPFETSLRQLGGAAGNLALRSMRGESAYPGLRRLVALFYEALRTGGPLPILPQDSILVARARQAILAS